MKKGNESEAMRCICFYHSLEKRNARINEICREIRLHDKNTNIFLGLKAIIASRYFF